MAAYYNEIDPYAAQWLRNLITAGHIAPGDVDERSIRDVHPADIIGYDQCHFFAGIGVWSHALRLAGWPDDEPVWTGSCPCQPFSAAGKRQGVTDDRHLWPEFYRLISAWKPFRVFGEQVASKDGLAWLDIVYADLEAAGYAVGAVDTCAAGFGAPHIRQRLYFVADTKSQHDRSGQSGAGRRIQSANSRNFGELADAEYAERRQVGQYRQDGRDRPDSGRQKAHGEPGTCGEVRDVGDSSSARLQGRSVRSGPESSEQITRTGSATNGFWSDAIWLPCIDGKARPTKPGIFPLAHGAPSRVGRLRAYGNSLVAPQAAEFVRAYLECRP